MIHQARQVLHQPAQVSRAITWNQTGGMNEVCDKHPKEGVAGVL
jgi:hypothetical protein